MPSLVGKGTSGVPRGALWASREPGRVVSGRDSATRKQKVDAHSREVSVWTAARHMVTCTSRHESSGRLPGGARSHTCTRAGSGGTSGKDRARGERADATHTDRRRREVVPATRPESTAAEGGVRPALEERSPLTRVETAGRRGWWDGIHTHSHGGASE